MKLLKQLFTASLLICSFHSGDIFAQPQPGADWANMDPQEMQKMIQQRTMESLRERLAITDEAEWKAIEPLLAKVSKLRTENLLSSGLGMMGGMRGGNAPGGGRGFPGFGTPDPKVDTLQEAIDRKAPTAEVKDALAKLRESRKQKQAELTKAQEELRRVLTVRQEATLVLNGTLD